MTAGTFKPCSVSLAVTRRACGRRVGCAGGPQAGAVITARVSLVDGLRHDPALAAVDELRSRLAESGDVDHELGDGERGDDAVEGHDGRAGAGQCAPVDAVNAAIGLALLGGRITTNPVAGVARLPHTRDERIRAQTTEVVEAIRRCLQRQDAALVSVLAYEGLRPGEAFALEWRDVLDDEGRPRERILVRRALSDHQISMPKSTHAREPELLTPVAAELAELYVTAGTPDLRSLIFPNTRGGFIRRQNWRKRAWLPALREVRPCHTCQATGRAGDRRCDSCDGTGTAGYFRPYDLRHTAATLLIYAGRTINEVAEHLGHADPGFTARIYTHIYRDGHKRRGVAIEEAIQLARNDQKNGR